MAGIRPLLQLFPLSSVMLERLALSLAEKAFDFKLFT
jgi:hypothetical protein